MEICRFRRQIVVLLKLKLACGHKPFVVLFQVFIVAWLECKLEVGGNG